jgi:hypothetical protein
VRQSDTQDRLCVTLVTHICQVVRSSSIKVKFNLKFTASSIEQQNSNFFISFSHVIVKTEAPLESLSYDIVVAGWAYDTPYGQ